MRSNPIRVEGTKRSTNEKLCEIGDLTNFAAEMTLGNPPRRCRTLNSVRWTNCWISDGTIWSRFCSSWNQEGEVGKSSNLRIKLSANRVDNSSSNCSNLQSTMAIAHSSGKLPDSQMEYTRVISGHCQIDRMIESSEIVPSYKSFCTTTGMIMTIKVRHTRRASASSLASSLAHFVILLTTWIYGAFMARLMAIAMGLNWGSIPQNSVQFPEDSSRQGKRNSSCPSFRKKMTTPEEILAGNCTLSSTNSYDKESDTCYCKPAYVGRYCEEACVY